MANTRQPLGTIEYHALRKITGAYKGSRHRKLGFIANVEPLQAILNHLQISWVARGLSTGDPHIHEAIKDGRFEDGSDPHYSDRSVIEQAYTSQTPS